ncbi:MAG: hypothetical protein CO093_11435 [Alphaproteobacteria bacterium CG_4_9_14_3_um_filter_47_13]|nr:MAG: hypothetical protein CO093_11435 [Alphaproteobacteria bacterium CG_4_9_14_3_um_filter_47_13]
MSEVANEDHQKELENIREDIDSLKNNVFALTKSVQHDVVDSAIVGFDKMKHKGQKALHELEKDIKEKPLQNLLIALGTGFALGALTRKH